MGEGMGGVSRQHSGARAGCWCPIFYFRETFDPLAPVLLSSRCWPHLDLDAGLSGDDADVDHVHEQAVVDHSVHVEDGLGGGVAVLDGLLEVEVHDVVAVVSDVGLVAFHAQLGLAALDLGQRRQALEGVQVAELHDLDGHGELAASEALDELGVVHDAHELV
jgi:hypothetical protein